MLFSLCRTEISILVALWGKVKTSTDSRGNLVRLTSVSSGLRGFRKHNVKLIGKLEVKVDGANEFCELIDSFAFESGA